MLVQLVRIVLQFNGDYMLILTNGLTECADEGFLKVANSLVKRIKKSESDVRVISYERKSELTDLYLDLNKLLLNYRLFAELRKNKSSFLFIPFPAKTIATALRVFIVSLVSKLRTDVVLVMKGRMNFLSESLLKMSRANIYVLSKEAEIFYKKFLPDNRVFYLKAGVDTQKFFPVSAQESKRLKIKYGFDPDIPVILHVGHLNEGRNVGELLKVCDEYQILLVTSTLTKSEQDPKLKKRLLSRKNLKIIDDYLPRIEEVYQLSDVYFFPTEEANRCIDMPLSCLEAAACNTPVVATRYEGLKDLIQNEGFYFIEKLTSEQINLTLNKAINEKKNVRDSILDYDWKFSVSQIINKR